MKDNKDYLLGQEFAKEELEKGISKQHLEGKTEEARDFGIFNDFDRGILSIIKEGEL